MKHQGVIYRTINDVTDLLYKTLSSRELDKKIAAKRLDIFSIDESFVQTIETDDLGTFSGSYSIVFVPKEYIAINEYIRSLKLMSENEILMDSHYKAFIEDELSATDGLLNDRMNIYSSGAEKIAEQPCYIFIYEIDKTEIQHGAHQYITKKFMATFAGIPTVLFPKVLNPKVTYDCSICGDYAVAIKEIPDFYYNTKGDLYCPKCAKNVLGLRHVGE